MIPATGWMDSASCVTIPGFTELEVWEQRKVCTDCPVVEPCRDYGIAQENPRQSPVYGGLTGRQLAAAAKAAGIERLKPQPSRLGVYNLACVVCGTTFSANRPQALYCTRSCQSRAYAERKAATCSR